MRKRNLFLTLLATSFMTFGGLTSCGNEVCPPAPEPEPAPTPEPTKYAVETLNATHLKVQNLNVTDKVEAGFTVTFDVVSDSADFVLDYVKVFYDGLKEAAVVQTDAHFTFTMPESNVAIQVAEKDAPYVEPEDAVTPVDLEALEFNKEGELAEKLDWAAMQLRMATEVEVEKLKSATLTYDTDSGSAKTHQVKETKVYNDFVTLDSWTSGVASTGFTRESNTRGYLPGGEYAFDYGYKTINFGDNSQYSTPSTTTTVNTFKVLKEEGATYYGVDSLTEDEAVAFTRSSGYLEGIVNTAFGEKSDKLFYASAMKSITMTEPTLSEDGKTYSFEMVGVYKGSSYSKYFNIYTLKFAIDGDFFLHSLSFKNDYYKDGFDEATNTVKEDAVFGYTAFDYELVYNRAADKNQGECTLDFDSFFATEYDINLQYSKYSDYTKHEVGEDKVVYGNSTLYTSLSNVKGSPLVEPKLVGTIEEGGLLYNEKNQTFTVNKLGELTLLYDNGRGEMKEFKVTAEAPEIKEMTLTLGAGGSTFFVENGAQKVNATILPSLAPQDVTVELVKGSEIATLEKREDGYYITPTGEGEVGIKATSNLVPTATKAIYVNFATKPNIEGVKAFITTHTIFIQCSKYSTDCGWINFNADGTGSYIATQSSRPKPSEHPQATFKYIINDDFTFTITPDEGKTLTVNSYSIEDVQATSNSSLSLKFLYNGKDNGCTLKYMNRIANLDDATKPS